MDSIEKIITEQVKAIVGVRPGLSDSLALIGIDSVGMAELTFEIEKKFNIQVDDDVLEVDTVGELVAYVRSKTD